MNNSRLDSYPDLEPELRKKLDLVSKLLKECFQNITNTTTTTTITTTTTTVINDNPDTTNGPDELWCPRTFDGLTCWSETPAGTTVRQTCPDFVLGFDPRRLSVKRCMENGSWFIHPDTRKPWTNYTTCIDVEDLSFRTMVNNIYVVGYSVSVAALFVSLAIFLYLSALRCTRIKIHMHLFMAFLINNILWIVWYKTVVTEPHVVQQNKAWCQILHLMTNYFMVTSYIWMFCEGLHLHIVLVVVFVKDEVAMAWFCALGWGLSFIIVMIYGLVRFFTLGETKRCWMDQSDSFWIITVPVVISLLASFVFLFNVVRVLVTKLQPEPAHHTRQAILKATRATLILIPLFGLHFILIPLRPFREEPGEKIYQVVSAVIISLQGLCLAILFCFTNHEVTTAAKAQYLHFFPPNDGGIAMTGFTGGESMTNTRI